MNMKTDRLIRVASARYHSLRIFSTLLLALPVGAQNGTAADAVTFNSQIAPIIYKNCSTCHRPGEAAPFSLLSYQDAKRKGKTIGKAATAAARVCRRGRRNRRRTRTAMNAG